MRTLPLLVAAAAVLPACKDHASPLDPLVTNTSRDDAPAQNGKAAPMLAGADLKGTLDKIVEGISKPGPYEAPEHSADFDSGKPHWGTLDLDGRLTERAAFSFTGGKGLELRKLTDRLRGLAKDDKLAGLVLTFDGVTASLPDAVELRAVIAEVRAAGKHVDCFTESAANAEYLVLAACERIGVAPVGDIAITGPAAMPIHLKGLLDKLGVTADFLHVGAYKGAAEPLTRDAPSKEMEETLGAILDRHYETMVAIIAKDRGLPDATVKALIDTGLFPSDAAKAAKLVDDVASFEEFRAIATGGAPWQKLDLDADKKSALAKTMELARFIGAVPPAKVVGDHVAVVYAVGDIVNGTGEGVLGAREHIAAGTLVPALHALELDPSVKAVVLRIDSGGGSAQASELIWRAVAALKAKKPVIVSMSDVAASGGYYIASGATKIFALDDTLTGSIGVVGGKLAPEGALAKLGVTAFPMGRGKRATMMASMRPWTDEEKTVIQANMDAVYKVFVGRVADGRKLTTDQVLPIAQGHVWVGAKGKELGLVDEIGGLDAALAEAQKLGGVPATTDLEVYPPEQLTLRDLLAGYGAVHVPFGLGADALLDEVRAAAPAVADETERLMRLALSFRECNIQTVTILPEVQ
ncbi:MAG TPA: signal peptide peptidase SppA [Kofleriaceae bacterium]|jgi:protease-4